MTFSTARAAQRAGFSLWESPAGEKSSISIRQDEDRILILNPEESGLIDLLNSGNYEDGSTVLIAVKYPVENNRNEAEIVEIITGE